MGFDKTAAAFFLKMRTDGIQFGRLLTLGHQTAYFDLADYRRILERLGRPTVKAVPEFADELLLNLGASTVEAMDFSAYERAPVVHDLNQPVPAQWHQQYDTIFDGGTLEHVFNFPTAVKNCMQMLKPQGNFVSITIPNNWQPLHHLRNRNCDPPESPSINSLPRLGFQPERAGS